MRAPAAAVCLFVCALVAPVLGDGLAGAQAQAQVGVTAGLPQVPGLPALPAPRTLPLPDVPQLPLPDLPPLPLPTPAPAPAPPPAPVQVPVPVPAPAQPAAPQATGPAASTTRSQAASAAPANAASAPQAAPVAAAPRRPPTARAVVVPTDGSAAASPTSGPRTAPRRRTPAASAGAPPHRRAAATSGSRAPARAVATPIATRRPAADSAAAVPAPAPLRRAVDDVIDSIPLPVPFAVKALIAGLGLICLVLASHSLLATRRGRLLRAQRAALLDDVGLLQQALLPAVPAQLGGLRTSVAYRPAAGPAAGGDFYDAFTLPGERVGILVGDVCGHGRGALGRTASVHYALRAYLEAGLEPAAALNTAGRVLDTHDAEPTTVVAAVYDATAGSLVYATAGHPPPVLIGAGAHEPVTAAASPPLGAGVPTGRRQTTVALPAGSLACFFTDGLIEAGTGRDRLGLEGLATMVAGLGDDEGAAVLLDRVTASTGHVGDDMAACIVRADDGGDGPSARIEQLEIDAAAARRAGLGTFLTQAGLDAGERDATIDRVRAVTGEHGRAFVRVLVDADGARVEVEAPVAPVAAVA